MIECDFKDCINEAVCVFGVALYPLPAMMAYVKSNEPLTTLVIGLRVCESHYQAETLDHLLPSASLEGLIRAVEVGSGTVVDRASAKLVRIDMGAKEYQVLLKARAEGKAKLLL